MLTDEQALRFCGCHCKQRDPLGLYGHQGVCEDCKGSGIDAAKRAELEELLRSQSHDAMLPPGELARLVGDRIIICIGVDGLQTCLLLDPCYEKYRVDDPIAFARDVVTELGREQEDGTTPIHLLIDQCAQRAVDNGSEWVSEVDDHQFDEEADDG